MIRGVGLDIVALERIERAWQRHPRFVERILTPAERDYCLRSAHLAGRKSKSCRMSMARLVSDCMVAQHKSQGKDAGL
jgi:phosphopantetheinyl transferase (holo-ACP synthase)